MTKSEVVQEICDKTGADRATVLNIVESFMVEVKDSLQKGESVTLRGFGTFLLKRRAQKTARNISTNTSIIVPEHNIPAFKPSDDFRSKLAKQ